ncbi:MAG: M23 family metallopeptidase [Candidatus Aminicenantes bacterium]|nr:M23 family metallopeptidase [Candidatus Aminicenantes bacterium]MDH5714505.1 M23 family metallopeptidase [Candidatus Aminicenantes bacterium]
MLKRFYTIIIVPHAAAKFRQIKIPHHRLVLISVICFFVIISIGFFAYNYVHLSARVGELDSLLLENARLKNENAEYKVSTDIISQKIAEFDDYRKKLNTIAGIQPPPEGGEYGGVGNLDDVQQSPATRALKHNLPSLQQQVKDMDKNFQLLMDHYENLSLLLASTPSIWPVRGYLSGFFRYRTDPFTGHNSFHQGIDISTPLGKPVIAPADGIVISASQNKGYGNIVVIKHRFGYTTRYGHLSKFAVRRGQEVKRGDVIGYIGQSGKATGPHLHYEVRINNKSVNPLNYILEE